MRLSIIGAGRVGQALGRLAFAAGYEIGDVICQTRSHANSAVKFIGSGTPQASAGASLSDAALTIIATTDDSIEFAVELLLASAENREAQALKRRSGGKATPPVVLHTSGALSSSVLRPLNRAGYSVGSCHPLQTFESPKSAVSLISKSYFCIEGDEAALSLARRFVRKIGARFFQIETGQKELYHAGAALSSAGVVALLSVSLEILSRCGLGSAEARKVLMPLVEGTVANVRSLGPAGALTGPIRRRDVGTVKRNLAALGKINREFEDLYKLLGRRGALLLGQAGSKKRELMELFKPYR